MNEIWVLNYSKITHIWFFTNRFKEYNLEIKENKNKLYQKLLNDPN